MLTMEDIIREGNPTLREIAQEVPVPITDEDKTLGAEMLTFLKNSQNPEIAEKYHLRGGVGLAAPQLDITKRIIALHVPGTPTEADPQPAPLLSVVMYNPKIIAHSVTDACLADGEGCLSVDRDVPGYVVRHQRITVSYTDEANQVQKIKLKNYEAIVVQHEIDHLNGIMFYDHINDAAPFNISPEVKVIS